MKISVGNGVSLGNHQDNILTYIESRIKGIKEKVNQMGSPGEWKDFLLGPFTIIYYKQLNNVFLAEVAPYNIPAHCIVVKGGDDRLVDFTGWGNPVFASLLDSYSHYVNKSVPYYQTLAE